MSQIETNSKNTNRVLKINVSNKVIDLTESFCLNANSLINLSMEYFLISFKTIINSKHKEYSFYICPSEIINEVDIRYLEKELKIKIQGDGSLFEIINQDSDVLIEFDSIQTTFVNSKNGIVLIKK